MRRLTWQGHVLALWRMTARPLIFGLLVLCAVVPFLPAQETGSAPGEAMLVLHGGRIVRGRITGSETGYTIDNVSGKLFIPLQQVRFQCRDLNEAYQRLHDELPPNSAAAHVALARWCITYKLLNEARDELQAAIALEPERNETQVLLRRVEDLLNPYIAPPPVEKPAPKRLSLLDVSPQPVESLGGFSRELAQQFPRRIQPILLNNCGNASCHGPRAENDFRLKLVGPTRGTHRHAVEENLASVLRYVDFEQPLRSPLLTIPKGDHGVRGRTLFQGPRGNDQYAELVQWIKDIAAERRQLAGKSPSSTARASTTSTDEAREMTPGDPFGVAGRRTPPLSTTSATNVTAVEMDDSAVTTAEAAAELPGPAPRNARNTSDRSHVPTESPTQAGSLPPPRDAFDPEIFNREVRGQMSRGR